MRAKHPPLAPDPAVEAIVAHYRERAAPLADRQIARIAAPFDRRPAAGGDHPLGRLVADAQLAATRPANAQIAFTNSGGVRSDLRGAPDGRVAFGDVYAVQPFGNTLVIMTLSGTELRALLELQWSKARPERARILQPSRGFTYAWDNRRPHGERVLPESLRLDGQVIEPERDYRVTVNSYLAAGGDSFRMLRAERDPVSGRLDVDALAQYLQMASGPAPLAPDRKAQIRRAASVAPVAR